MWIIIVGMGLQLVCSCCHVNSSHIKCVIRECLAFIFWELYLLKCTLNLKFIWWINDVGRWPLVTLTRCAISCTTKWNYFTASQQNKISIGILYIWVSCFILCPVLRSVPSKKNVLIFVEEFIFFGKVIKIAILQ